MTALSKPQSTTMILWAVAWAAALIVSAILLNGNPIKDWIQSATTGCGRKSQERCGLFTVKLQQLLGSWEAIQLVLPDGLDCGTLQDSRGNSTVNKLP